MAYLAIRGSGAVNGVSQLHGEVSRCIFQPLFPRCPRRGAHWLRHQRRSCADLGFSGFGRVVDQYCGKERWRGETDQVGEAMRQAPDRELWAMRQASRQTLVNQSRQRYSQQTGGLRSLPGANCPAGRFWTRRL